MPQATIHTDFGNMTLDFYADKAPEHVENCLGLAKSGFYDGLAFHRIVEGFMIQGGCPTGDGTGNGPTRLKAEFNDTPHQAGTLSMARSADPDSASCQFFICLDEASFLDGQYSAFGKVADDASMAILKKIGQLPTRDSGGGEKSTPTERVAIQKITVSEDPA